MQRLRLGHLRWHLKTSVHVATRLCGERDLGLLVLAGEERVLAHMEQLLLDSRAQLAGTLPPSPHAAGDELERQVQAVLAGRRCAEREAALDHLHVYLGWGLLVSGLAGVIIQTGTDSFRFKHSLARSQAAPKQPQTPDE